MDLKSINELNNYAAAEVFGRCCGSHAWVEKMLSARPFASDQALCEQADRSFKDLARADWMDAFAAHPKIGDISSLKKKYSITKNWAENEQAGAKGISDAVAEDLASSNEQYFQKFGYIFIVCATGKTAEEMLLMLKQRLNNDAETELSIAAEEQQKITHLRLEKL
ncbi:2-oxo-4-hydroxy-4-carboxy-5-ureidoimidazoline decarboxylase [soil metagenome]